MTTPHDDDLRPELLDVPDHRTEFWTVLDADLAAAEREEVVPLVAASSARPRARGLLLVAAVLAVLGGIGAWFAFGGDDDGPDVAVDPGPSVTTAPEPTTSPTTEGEVVPADVVRSATATVERVSVVGPAGTFALRANEDGTVIVRNGEAAFGYHAPSGATWWSDGETTLNETDPIGGRDRIDSLLFLDLAEAVRYGELGTAGERQGRATIEATVELADNESGGWFGRTATVTIDDETGFVLDAVVSDATGDIVEELHLTDIEWNDEPVDISGALGAVSDWTLTEGMPAAPVVGDGYLVPEGVEPVRTFTTEAAVQSGSEAGNPASDGAYVIDVTTAPWRHSKLIVLGRTAGEWNDPLASEGWFVEPEAVTPGDGELAGIPGELTSEPPQRPRVWFDEGSELVVAIQGLVDPTTAERLWNLAPAEAKAEPFVPDDLPAITAPPSGAESALSIEDVERGGMVVARRTEGGPAAATAWTRAVDEIRWEPDQGDSTILDTGDAHAVVLLDAFVDDDGEIAVIYGEIPSPDDVEPGEANLWLQRFGEPRSEAVSLGWFTGPEYGVDAATRGGDRIAISAGADLGEVFSFYDLGGNEVEEPNNPVPVGHRYGQPPYYQHAALSPDGRTLAFVQGPDFDDEAGAQVGDWELVVVDLDSGDATARIALFDRGTIEVTHLDFDGEWAIVSHDDPIVDRAEPVTALAVNTTTGTVTSLPDAAGIVTLVR